MQNNLPSEDRPQKVFAHSVEVPFACPYCSRPFVKMGTFDGGTFDNKIPDDAALFCAGNNNTGCGKWSIVEDSLPRKISKWEHMMILKASPLAKFAEDRFNASSDES